MKTKKSNVGFLLTVVVENKFSKQIRSQILLLLLLFLVKTLVRLRHRMCHGSETFLERQQKLRGFENKVFPSNRTYLHKTTKNLSCLRRFPLSAYFTPEKVGMQLLLTLKLGMKSSSGHQTIYKGV